MSLALPRKPLLYTHLKSDELVVNHNLLGQEIRTYRGFILTREPLIHVLVHQGRLSNSKFTKYSL
jgi:hypothetical protein